MRILLLGGTTEASQMAALLAGAGRDAIFSYAGRTKVPITQPLPTRIGGFGGVPGLQRYLREQAITHVIDATHPFAAGMSGNAHEACQTLGVPLIRLERPAWAAQTGDRWTHFQTLEDAAAALPADPARIFLAIGKQQIGCFASRPEHHYLLRLVDAPEGPLPLSQVTVVLDRGPFDVATDQVLMQDHRITHVVAKNSGGAGAVAKMTAARGLSLPVLMVDRPVLPGGPAAPDAEAVMRWLDHSADRGV